MGCFKEEVMNAPSFFQNLMSGARLVVLPKPEPKVNDAEKDLAESLLRIARTHGTFDESGCGIWAGYEPAITNENQNIGVKCSNCVLYAGGNRCKIISFDIEPNGYCRFAVIPDGVVKMGD
jgi:hypothetical protein